MERKKGPKKNNETPLGINQNVFKSLTAKEKKIIKIIDGADLSFLVGEQLFRSGISKKIHHVTAIDELKKFFAIKVITKLGGMGVFSPIVAETWHAFILDTRKYEKFCKVIYGKLIHHVPGGGPKATNKPWMAVYREWFGDFPYIWKLDLSGAEIPGYEHAMNVVGFMSQKDLDSDDSKYKDEWNPI